MLHLTLLCTSRNSVIQRLHVVSTMKRTMSFGGDTPHQIHGICARAVLDRNTCQGTTGLALAGHLDYGI